MISSLTQEQVFFSPLGYLKYLNTKNIIPTQAQPPHVHK